MCMVWSWTARTWKWGVLLHVQPRENMPDRCLEITSNLLDVVCLRVIFFSGNYITNVVHILSYLNCILTVNVLFSPISFCVQHRCILVQLRLFLLRGPSIFVKILATSLANLWEFKPCMCEGTSLRLAVVLSVRSFVREFFVLFGWRFRSRVWRQ